MDLLQQDAFNFVDFSTPRRFLVDSPLRAYLLVKKPTADYDVKETVTLSEVILQKNIYSNDFLIPLFLKILESLKEVISEERLYDSNNASVVLCDVALEAALDVKALHLTQLRLLNPARA